MLFKYTYMKGWLMKHKERIFLIKTLLILIFSSSVLVKAQTCGPRIGDTAPSFTAESTQGTIKFPDDYAGKWIIFFSHPADFTPVCKTEFKRLAGMVKELEALNAKLVGISVDPEYTHEAWMRNLEKEMQKGTSTKRKINFPVISDPSMNIVKKYGMVHPKESKTQTVRSVYFIDPQGIVRAIFYYPIANGRSFNEVKRLLRALQITDKKHVATPSDWQPGRPTIPLEKTAKDILPD
jgi:peroxiredoxin 2/4